MGSCQVIHGEDEKFAEKMQVHRIREAAELEQPRRDALVVRAQRGVQRVSNLLHEPSGGGRAL